MENTALVVFGKVVVHIEPVHESGMECDQADVDQHRPLRRDPVDLLAVLADVVHDVQALHGRDHVVRLTAAATGHAPVVAGDDARLRQVFGNLLTNAVTHTPAGSAVEVGLRAGSQHVVVEVRDTGPGMAPEVAARVF